VTFLPLIPPSFSLRDYPAICYIEGILGGLFSCSCGDIPLLDERLWRGDSLKANFIEEERFLLKIRLTLMGSKKKPKYRIVVIEKSRARDGRYVDVLGQYDPKKNPAALNLNKEKYAYWVSKGAQPSNTVKSFLAKVS
jgi:small subunit ribosomal protein S16